MEATAAGEEDYPIHPIVDSEDEDYPIHPIVDSEDEDCPMSAEYWKKRFPIPPGGWHPIVDSEYESVVAMVAKLALEEHNNRNNLDLSFVSLVKGRQRVVGGMMYDMVIAATSGGGATRPMNYEVVVRYAGWMINPDDKLHLISFKQVLDI